MKKKIYTLSHNIQLLKENTNVNKRFSSSEHSRVIEKEYKNNIFLTKDSLISNFIIKNYKKLISLDMIINFIKKNKLKNIISLGGGEFVLEYLLKNSLDSCEVAACDFNSFFVKKGKEFFPELKLDEFDFFNDDFSDLKSKFNLNFDIALFFGSSYVMDDDEFIKLFNDLKKNNVKYIVDFHAGYMNLDDMIKFKLEPIIKNTYIRKLFNKKPIAFKGKFHGYSRNHSELIKLYKKSGLKIVNEINDESYKYIAILS